MDLLRNQVGAAAPARSLCLLTRVNETFPKNASLPTLAQAMPGGRPAEARLSGGDHKGFDNDADLLIPELDAKADNSQDIVKKGEPGMHFYVNGYKLPSSAGGIQIKRFL